MEQTGYFNQAQGRGHPSQPRRQSTDAQQIKNPATTTTTLNSALFTPVASFPLFPSTTKSPLTHEAHLQKIISNLTAQRETVKSNLILVATSRAREVRKIAQAELNALPTSSIDDISNDILPQDEKAIEETLRTMRLRFTPSAGNSKGEEFELKPKPTIAMVSAGSRRSSATTPNGTKPFAFREGGKVIKATRTAAVIRAESRVKIRDIIDSAVLELENYEKRAEKTLTTYRGLLDKEKVRSRAPHGPARQNRRLSGAGLSNAVVPRGILTNSHAPGPVDRVALRRMSADDSVAGTGMGTGQSMNGKGKSKDDLRREDEARALAELEARASTSMVMPRELSMERDERAEDDELMRQLIMERDAAARRGNLFGA